METHTDALVVFDQQREKPGNLFSVLADRRIVLAMNIGRGSAERTGSVIRQIVEKAYRCAGLAPGCDPRDLAERLGLEPCPSPCAVAYVADRTLHYPDNLRRHERGEQVLRALGRHLLGLECVPITTASLSGVTEELALPTYLARKVAFGSLDEVQPHVTIEFLCRIYMRHHASGVFAAVS